MIGMVLVAHEHVGESMLSAVEHVLGPQPLSGALSVGVAVDIEADTSELEKQLSRLIQRCDAGNGVLLFADMFGGTPCNLALASMKQHHVEVISGFNLPMLIKAASLRPSLDNLSLLAKTCRDSGRQHMHIASELLASDKAADG